ncbi:kinase-like domain-containing protein [Fimicolochytrium jonesii]|uniref:kinase-like domain-containing protein n=1 Tax=Fimicolochytrium jonesii TaxID=1396493 RepID=UPI0022FDE3AD|nr:kinase-like domain-containing protein [Fimicolochytrium jonesii]KAI8826664.1 kinase-like domain-containing protein [Fimicolochytrium jonesii]
MYSPAGAQRENARPPELPPKAAAPTAPLTRNPPPSSFPEPPLILSDRKGGAQFSRGGLLGEGGFARCYEAIDPTGARFAVKVICKASLKSSKQKQKLIAEIRIHQLMSHPHIVGFKQVFEDDDFVYMILELCENRTFVEMLKKRRRLTEPEVRHYMWQLLDAVSEVHRRGVIHRDLKLGNFFLTRDMKLKLGDFGLAAMIKHDGERKKTICGTPNYIAPEVLFDTQAGHSYEVDIWSLGVVMFTFIVGRPPFQTKDVKAIYKKIRENQYEFPAQLKISDSARSMIESLLQTRPELRPSVSDIMGHDFFSMQPILRTMPVSALTSIPEAALVDTTNPSARTSPDPFLSVSVRTPLNENFSAPADNRSTVPMPIGRTSLRSPASAPGPKPSDMVIRSKASPAKPQSPPISDFERLRVDVAENRPPTENRPPIPSSWMRRTQSHDSDRNGQRSDSIPTKPKVAHLPTPDPETEFEDRRAPLRADYKNSSAERNGSSEEPEMRAPPSPSSERTNSRPSTLSASSSRNRGSTTLSSTRTQETGPRRSLNMVAAMHKNLQDALSDTRDVDGRSLDAEDMKSPSLFITKWIDYSNKYGLGYQLRDGSVGVYFNDATSIILAADNHHFEYLYYDRGSDRPFMHRRAHTMTEFPNDLMKKVTLLKHFRSYMQENLYKACKETLPTPPRTENLHFLTKYLRTKHGVIFRLSNHVLQLNLFDHSKVILSNDGLTVTYIDQRRESSTNSLGYFTRTGNKELLERLKYMKEVLHSMLVKKQQRSEDAAAAAANGMNGNHHQQQVT